jgi:hypothetical protein
MMFSLAAKHTSLFMESVSRTNLDRLDPGLHAFVTAALERLVSVP